MTTPALSYSSVLGSGNVPDRFKPKRELSLKRKKQLQRVIAERDAKPKKRK